MTTALRLRWQRLAQALALQRDALGLLLHRAAREATDPAGRFADLLDAVPEGTRDELQVLGGLHEGASFPLTQRVLTIGGTPDCDIVLQDPALAGWQARLVRGADGYALLPPDGHVALAPVSSGREGPARVQRHAPGGVELALVRQGPPVPAEPAAWRRPRRLLAGTVAGVALLAVALVGAGPWAAARSQRSLAEQVAAANAALTDPAFADLRYRRDADGTLELTGLVAGAAELAKLQAFLAQRDEPGLRLRVRSAAELVEQVRQALSTPGLQVVHAGGGHLRVEGSTTQMAVKARLRSLAQELAGTAVLDDQVALVDARAQERAPLPLPVRITDVMPGPGGYFRTDTGARFFEGARLPDGAEVLAIEAERIVFRRGDETFTYRLE